jgi:hypothetical protein
MRILVPVLLLLFVSPPFAEGRTWRIYEDGSGHAPTVQAAIDSAGDGDVVLVGPGTYYENLNLLGKAIELRSSAGPEATTLNGSRGDNSVITCASGETNATVITGFTITGGTGYARTAYSRTGGGIRCTDSCPRIEGNNLRENYSLGELGSDSRGGAISLGGPDPCKVVIKKNTIEQNVARSNGGGINIAGPCLIEGNMFRRNSTLHGDGAGIYDLVAEDVSILSNVFIENEAADHGGAAYIGRSTPGPASGVTLIGNIMIGNSALNSGLAPDCSGGAIWLYGSGAVVQRNTIAFNSGPTSGSDVGGGICFYNTAPDVLIERNIIFRNRQGALRTFGPAMGVVRRNLVFDNGLEDIKLSPDSNVSIEENLFTDPLFCLWSLDSRGELSRISPALNSPYGVIGAVDVGSCGPEIRCLDCTEVQRITWGRLKARYR